MDGRMRRFWRGFDWAGETERLVWAVRVRWAVIGGFLTLGAGLHPLGLFPELDVLAAAAFLGVAANLANQVAVERGRWVFPVTVVAVTLDNFLITWVSARSGASHSPFVVMYSVQVVATAMLVNAPAAAASAILAVIGGGVLVALEGAGLSGPSDLFDSTLRSDPTRAAERGALAWGLMLAYGLVLLVFLGGFVSDRLRRSERALRLRNDELVDACQRLQQAEAQMVHTEKMRALGQLVAGVAHELNNPISFVSANIAYLRGSLTLLTTAARRGVTVDERPDLESLLDEVPAILEDCEEGARRVKRIVGELRTFARADESREWDAVDLDSSVRATARLLRHHFRDGLRLELVLGRPRKVLGSAGQLDQVLLNLVVNAVEALDGNGRVLVTTLEEGSWGIVEVADDGPGIAPENLARVFEPFFTTKPVGKGTGVGLSLSYAIARRHGGDLRVRSTPGAGATFQLRLPVAPSPPRPAQLIDERNDAKGASVVDDAVQSRAR